MEYLSKVYKCCILLKGDLQLCMAKIFNSLKYFFIEILLTFANLCNRQTYSLCQWQGVLRICWLPLMLWGKTTPTWKKRYLGYDARLYPVVRPQFWSSGVCGVLFHCYYSLVYSDTVVSVRVPTIGHIDLFENYQYSIGMLEIMSLCAKKLLLNRNSYLKPYNCV